MSDFILGQECVECGVIDDDPFDGDCQQCDSSNTVEVQITPCPVDAGTTSSGKECADDDHHWGRGDHVHTVLR